MGIVAEGGRGSVHGLGGFPGRIGHSRHHKEAAGCIEAGGPAGSHMGAVRVGHGQEVLRMEVGCRAAVAKRNVSTFSKQLRLVIDSQSLRDLSRPFATGSLTCGG